MHSRAFVKRPTWLELFYDLVFVAAFLQLGNGLAASITLERVLTSSAVFVPLWVAWSGFTFYVNRFTVDDFLHRSLVFAQMTAVGAMAMSVPRVLEGETTAFSFAAGVALLLVGVMYLRTFAQVSEGRAYARFWGLIFGLSGVAWLIAAWVPDAWTKTAWAAGSIVVLAAPLSKPSRTLAEEFPIDFDHLGERYGLLTIVVLGESFVKVLLDLTSQTQAMAHSVAEAAPGVALQGQGLDVYLEASIILLITASVWWIYFDDIAGSTIRKGEGQWIVWLYAHLPFQLAVTGLGVALKEAIHFSVSAPAPTAERWLVSGTIGLIFLSVAAIDSVTERRQAELSDRARVNARIVSALLVLVLAPATVNMSGATFLALVAIIVGAQVIFDMAMAPFEATEHLEIGHKLIADIARETRDIQQQGASSAEVPSEAPPRRDIREAVRKGTPSDLRRDLYFYFIEGNWSRLIAGFGVLFMGVNTFFAALYTFEPGAIENVRSDSFLDAFFFSVETMATIGYGKMVPASDYGHAIATLEAAVSIIGIALVTGLVFAKASRPRSSVLFSRNAVVTMMNDKPVFAFRIGNARGNEILDASIDVTVLKDELTREGQHLRRLHDVRLVRQRSPLFTLTWFVMHEIDDESPFRDIDWGAPDTALTSIIVTLVGHDGTYNQTVHARHTYYPEDIRRDARFVDIISRLKDGRLMVDYARFHDLDPA
ncbi:MAG: low temperature requirement protein A [Deltaproteobacteria bacterium]|nr:low temperature requirement protein A [Deltaproteobacteria bacterium]